MRISSTVLGTGVAAFIVVAVALLMIFGLWNDEQSKVPAKFTTGQFAGLNNPSDIRGSYTFEDIEHYFSVPAETIAQAFALDTSQKGANEYKAKDLEELYKDIDNGEVGTDSIKWFVSLYDQVPYEPEATTLLPESAIRILADLGSIDETTATVLTARSIAINQTYATSATQEHDVASEEMIIKGNTTYSDLLIWGLDAETIESIVGYPITDRTIKLRDDFSQKGLEFSVYKNVLQEALNML